MFVKIEKEAYEAKIFTCKFEIHGFVHVLSQERFTDFLGSSSSQFLPITDAVIKSIDTGKIIAKTDFLSLNKNEVQIIFPATKGQDE